MLTARWLQKGLLSKRSRWVASLCGIVLVAGLLAHCSPLGFFNTVAGRDADTKPLGLDLAYGEDSRQRLDIYGTDNHAGLKPVLVFFYGGSWSGGTKQEYSFAGSAFAAQGFIAVVPDYRLYPQVQFPDFLDDGASAIRWVRDHISAYGGDPNRIVLVGHSAGAYNAVMLGLDHRYLQKAGVPVSSIRAVSGLAGPYDFLPLDDDDTIATFGNAPKPLETQPVFFAHSGMPAMFLATGDKDTTVKPRNTQALAQKLRESGNDVVEKIYSGLDHDDMLLSLSRPLRNEAPLLAEMSAFLMSHAQSRKP